MSGTQDPLGWIGGTPAPRSPVIPAETIEEMRKELNVLRMRCDAFGKGAGAELETARKLQDGISGLDQKVTALEQRLNSVDSNVRELHRHLREHLTELNKHLNTIEKAPPEQERGFISKFLGFLRGG